MATCSDDPAVALVELQKQLTSLEIPLGQVSHGCAVELARNALALAAQLVEQRIALKAAGQVAADIQQRDAITIRELQAQLAALEDERDTLRDALAALREALSEDPTRWSFSTLVYATRYLLEVVYPAHVFTGVSGDSGPALVVALREALERCEQNDPALATLAHAHDAAVERATMERCAKVVEESDASCSYNNCNGVDVIAAAIRALIPRPAREGKEPA